MQDVHSYRCFFRDDTGAVVGFDAHDFSDDAAAIDWATGLKVPDRARTMEIRDDEKVIHERPLPAAAH